MNTKSASMLVIALSAASILSACGKGPAGATKETTTKKEEVRQLDPHPPMSASDIDSIVNETRGKNAPRGEGAPAPIADNASNTN